MADTPKLSVVIGTYNQVAVLRRTLESLFKQSLPPALYEIVLVDSFSTDGTDLMIEELSPPCRLNYLRVENKGKAAARNFGIKEAKGSIIFLTDADMEADPNLLLEHFNVHKIFPNAAFEGLTINPDGQPYIKNRLKNLQKLKWSYFLTGNLSVRKSELVSAGLFDEHFAGYGWEDIELGYRLNLRSLPLYYLPAAVNFHNHPVGNELMLERKYEMGRSAAYFYKKHPNFEIKLFLGMNFLAMAVYRWLARHPKILQKIKNRYILEEYYYRKGLTEG